MITRQDVWIGNRLAGRLESADQVNLSFTYDAGYQDDPEATPLSMSMPIQRDVHPVPIATVFFDGLLPEQGPSRQRLAREAGVSPHDLVGMLSYVGGDLPGAVCVVDEGAGLRPEGGSRSITDHELAELVAAARQSALIGQSPLMDHGQWSLAGAQAKIALAYHDGEWGVPYGSEPTTHIVKPAVPGFENLDAVEVVCLRAAQTLGLSAASSWLQPLSDGTHASVIVRYDRVRAGDSPVVRVHQEDFCQALGVPGWQKYERDGGPSLQRIASVLRRLPLAQRHDSIRRFVDSLAFNVAVAGTDGHARNYSLLLSGADASLAPLYDLASALPYTRPFGRRFDSVRKLHSSFVLGSTDAFTRLSRSDWDRVSELLDIPAEEVHERVAQMQRGIVESLEQATSEVAHESGLDLSFDWAAMVDAYTAQRAS